MTLPLALTMGEPAGIGGEFSLDAGVRRGDGEPLFYVVDDPDRLAGLAARLGWTVPIKPIATSGHAVKVFPNALPVLPVGGKCLAEPGRPNPADARLVIGAIDHAVAEVKAGRAAAVVTNPINKEALYGAGFRHPGHTEYLGELAGQLYRDAGGTPVLRPAAREMRRVPGD